MRIGELAEAAGVTASTVRYYEAEGLLPEPRRTAAGYRDYDGVALERLAFVRDAQASGLTLSEILSVLELKDAGKRSCEHTAELLESHLSEIDEQIERLQKARGELAALADRARGLDPAACTDPQRCQVIVGSHGLTLDLQVD